MGVETAIFIANLNLGWPLGLDTVSQGDDHLRLIKKVLKATFPGAGGQGLASAINVTETEFNYLAGVTSSIQAQLTSCKFPAGTVLPFHQAAPPPGWVLLNVHDFMLRAVTVGGGDGGGADSPISMTVVPSHSHGAGSLTVDFSGDHAHTVPLALVSGVLAGTTSGSAVVSASITGTSVDGAHTHSLSGSIGANAGAANWAPKYANVILCSKS